MWKFSLFQVLKFHAYSVFSELISSDIMSHALVNFPDFPNPMPWFHLMWETKDNISIYLLANQYLPEGKQQMCDCFKRLWIIHPAKTNIDNVVQFDILTQDFVFNWSFWSKAAFFFLFFFMVLLLLFFLPGVCLLAMCWSKNHPQ